MINVKMKDDIEHNFVKQFVIFIGAGILAFILLQISAFMNEDDLTTVSGSGYPVSPVERIGGFE